MSDVLSGDSLTGIEFKRQPDRDTSHCEIDVSTVSTHVSDNVISGDKQDTKASDMECKEDAPNKQMDRNTSEQNDDQLTDNGMAEDNVKESAAHENMEVLSCDRDGMKPCSTLRNDVKLPVISSTRISEAQEGWQSVSDEHLSTNDSRNVSNDVTCEDLDKQEEQISIKHSDVDNKMSTVLTGSNGEENTGTGMESSKGDQQVSDIEDEAKRTIEIVFPNDAGVKESLTVKEGDKLVTVSLNIPSDQDEICHTEYPNWYLSATSRSHNEEASKKQLFSSSNAPINRSSEVANSGHALDVKNNEDDDDDDDVIITSAVIVNKNYNGWQERFQSSDVRDIISEEKNTKLFMEEDVVNGSETVSMSSVDDSSWDDILEDDIKHLSDNHPDNISLVRTGQNLQKMPVDNDKSSCSQSPCQLTVDKVKEDLVSNDVATSVQSAACGKVSCEISAENNCEKLPEINHKPEHKTSCESAVKVENDCKTSWKDQSEVTDESKERVTSGQQSKSVCRSQPEVCLESKHKGLNENTCVNQAEICDENKSEISGKNQTEIACQHFMETVDGNKTESAPEIQNGVINKKNHETDYEKHHKTYITLENVHFAATSGLVGASRVHQEHLSDRIGIEDSQLNYFNEPNVFDASSRPCIQQNEDINSEMSEDCNGKYNNASVVESIKDGQLLPENEQESRRTIEIVFPNDAGVKESLIVKEGNKLVTVSLKIPENQDDTLHDVSSNWYMSRTPRSHFEERSSIVTSHMFNSTDRVEHCSSDTSNGQIISVQKRRETPRNDVIVQSSFITGPTQNSLYPIYDPLGHHVQKIAGHRWKSRQTGDTYKRNLVWSNVLLDSSKVNRRRLYKRKTHFNGKRQSRTVTKINFYTGEELQYFLNRPSYQSSVKQSYKKCSGVPTTKQPTSEKSVSSAFSKSWKKKLEKPAVVSSAGRSKQLAKRLHSCSRKNPRLPNPPSVAQQPQCNNSEWTHNSVILSPECRKRYSHLLNALPVVSLKRLKIDGLPVRLPGLTSDQLELPKKRKRGRPPKRKYPASGCAEIRDVYPNCKQTDRHQSVMEVHSKTVLDPDNSEHGGRKRQSEFLINTPCVMLEKLPSELVPPTGSGPTYLKSSAEEDCVEKPSTPQQQTGEKYTSVLNKSLSVSLERLPGSTLNLDEKQRKQRQRSKSDMDKPEDTASVFHFKSCDGSRTSDDLKQQLNSSEAKSEPDKNCYSALAQEGIAKSKKLFSKVTNAKREHCPNCHVITTRRKLYKHFHNMHRNSKYPFCCSKCQRSFLFEDVCQKHSQKCNVTNTAIAPSEQDQHDVDRVDRVMSDGECQNSRRYVSPELSNLPTILYRCMYCPKAFITPSLLFHHENIFHADNRMIQTRRKEGKVIFPGTMGMVYLCTNCNSYFTGMFDYKVHQKVAHGIDECSCTDFRQYMSSVKSEFSEVSDGSEACKPKSTYCSATSLRCQCLVCFKKFFLPEAMEKHTMDDHGIKIQMKEVPGARIQVFIEQVMSQVNDNKMESSANGESDSDDLGKLQKLE